ncbi:unnamed protein product, partial [Linum tenue]
CGGSARRSASSPLTSRPTSRRSSPASTSSSAPATSPSCSTRSPPRSETTPSTPSPTRQRLGSTTPVYGCVGFITKLQHRLKQLQLDLHLARQELAKYIGPHALLPSSDFAAPNDPGNPSASGLLMLPAYCYRKGGEGKYDLAECAICLCCVWWRKEGGRKEREESGLVEKDKD